MFDLVPFKNRRQNNLVERDDDPFAGIVSGFFDDMMDFAGRSFRADIKEKESEYIIEAEMPGMKKKISS